MTEKRYKTLLKILSSINIEFTIKGTEPNPKENSFFIVCLLYTSPSPRDS